MSSAISQFYTGSVDFLKNQENRRNLAATSGMLMTAAMIVCLVFSGVPIFPTVCLGGIMGILMGLVTYQIAGTLKKILDEGYQNYPMLTGAAAIVVLAKALIEYEDFLWLGLSAVPMQSLMVVSISLMCGMLVYEIGTGVLECMNGCKEKKSD